MMLQRGERVWAKEGLSVGLCPGLCVSAQRRARTHACPICQVCVHLSGGVSSRLHLRACVCVCGEGGFLEL